MSQTQAVRPTPWGEPEGIRLLRGVATAMVRLAESDGTESPSRPYPEEAQQALNDIVLACLLLKARPPESLPELIDWAARRPVDAWPLTLPTDAVRPGSLLLDRATRRPTQLCHEWAVDSEESTALSERPFMGTAATRCREEEYPEAYQAFRSLLIRRPVLTYRDLVTLPMSDDGVLGPVAELLHDIYQPAPASYLDRKHRTYTACGRCRTLLHPTATGGMWCERRSCQDRDSVRPGRTFRTDDGGGVHLLIGPLRQWVAAPGILEERLARRLVKCGASVELWPDYGAYGMCIRLPDGTTLAAEYKDWAGPALLGRRAAPPPSGPSYDRCVWVVPAGRLREQPAYRSVFARYRPGRSPQLVSDRELVDTVHKAARTRLSRIDASNDQPAKGLF